jgi:ABC-type antimicrobial peptide transport system permease subunit
MIWAKLVFGGFGRRGLEALVAVAVLSIAAAIVAGAMMVIKGANDAMARAEREDRPDIVQVKSRFNRAVFETPRSGHLPPVTLPVYEPLIDPEKLSAAGGTVLGRQSLLRNVVSGESFLNLYIFGIEPEKESQASVFSVGRGRFLRSDDGPVAVLDQASAQALGVKLGDSFPVRKADGQDFSLTVVGILDRFDLRYPPTRTIAAPALIPDSNYVSSGVFVTLRVSEEIFGRSTLTDALVIAPAAQDVPSVVDGLREAFRLEPGVFVSERYGQFRRKVHDFAQTLALFAIITVATAALAGSFAANLLHDVYADRRRQYAMLLALGFSPMQTTMVGISVGVATAGAGALIGALVGVACTPSHFAMPSLMADLGTIEPSFNALIAAVLIGLTLLAIALGMAPTAWRLHRRTVAGALSQEGR